MKVKHLTQKKLKQLIRSGLSTIGIDDNESNHKISFCYDKLF